MRATRPAGAARPPRQTDESVRSARLLSACDARGCTQAAREPRDTAERRNAPDATMQTMWCMSVPGSRVLRCAALCCAVLRCAALHLHWHALNASRHGACLRVTLTHTASVPRTHTTCACSCRAGQGTSHTLMAATRSPRPAVPSADADGAGAGAASCAGRSAAYSSTVACRQALSESARDRPVRCDAMQYNATT
jgi:hypothetical protein